jgi:glycosyltransferase involved in cell wall biosynthesis
MVRYLREHRPAIVVTAMPAANVLVPLAAALARTRTRVVITHHSPADTHNRNINRLDSWTGRLGCVRAVVSVSDAVGESLGGKPAAYRRKRRTIHNALPGRIEHAIASLVADRRRPMVPDRRIVALGRLTYQKNYPLLIRAMAFVPDALLDIVGGGEDEAELRALADATGVADRITFHGHTPRAAALALAAGARVFVQVSHYEGHSLALIEAARLGLPIVVSDVDVQIEGVTARDGSLCGLIVPRDEPRVLGQVLCDLLDKTETHAHWALRARQLGAEASNAAMIDAYQVVIEESRCRG